MSATNDTNAADRGSALSEGLGPMTTETTKTTGPGLSALSEGLGLPPPTANWPLVVHTTEVRQFSEYGKYAVGDYVTRDGSDVQLVKDMEEDGYCGTFVCVVAPADGWCAVGEEEFNLCRRYSRVKYRPNVRGNRPARGPQE